MAVDDGMVVVTDDGDFVEDLVDVSFVWAVVTGCIAGDDVVVVVTSEVGGLLVIVVGKLDWRVVKVCVGLVVVAEAIAEDGDTELPDSSPKITMSSIPTSAIAKLLYD